MTKGFYHLSEAIKGVVKRNNLNKVMTEKTLNDLVIQYFQGQGIAVKVKCVIKNNAIWAQCSSLMEKTFVSEHEQELSDLAGERGLKLPWKFTAN